MIAERYVTAGLNIFYRFRNSSIALLPIAMLLLDMPPIIASSGYMLRTFQNIHSALYFEG